MAFGPLFPSNDQAGWFQWAQLHVVWGWPESEDNKKGLHARWQYDSGPFFYHRDQTHCPACSGGLKDGESVYFQPCLKMYPLFMKQIHKKRKKSCLCILCSSTQDVIICHTWFRENCKKNVTESPTFQSVPPPNTSNLQSVSHPDM